MADDDDLVAWSMSIGRGPFAGQQETYTPLEDAELAARLAALFGAIYVEAAGLEPAAAAEMGGAVEVSTTEGHVQLSFAGRSKYREWDGTPADLEDAVLTFAWSFGEADRAEGELGML